MNSTVIVVSFIIGGVWLLLLSFLFWQLYAHYANLVRGANNRTLKSILDTLIKDVEASQKDIANLKDRCDTIEKDGLLHIQKIGLLRFNPFNDTGGDQSFILALVDGRNTGVVISGLYSRSGTRWYAKRVLEGKGADHELSDDEKKALKEAKNV